MLISNWKKKIWGFQFFFQEIFFPRIFFFRIFLFSDFFPKSLDSPRKILFIHFFLNLTGSHKTLRILQKIVLLLFCLKKILFCQLILPKSKIFKRVQKNPLKLKSMKSHYQREISKILRHKTKSPFLSRFFEFFLSPKKYKLKFPWQKKTLSWCWHQ